MPPFEMTVGGRELRMINDDMILFIRPQVLSPFQTAVGTILFSKKCNFYEFAWR
jgi:hypothetical protein